MVAFSCFKNTWHIVVNLKPRIGFIIGGIVYCQKKNKRHSIQYVTTHEQFCWQIKSENDSYRRSVLTQKEKKNP
jgi:hypothetical protein